MAWVGEEGQSPQAEAALDQLGLCHTRELTGQLVTSRV